MHRANHWELSNLFLAFSRTGGATKRRTAIALAATRRVMTAHKHRLCADFRLSAGPSGIYLRHRRTVHRGLPQVAEGAAACTPVATLVG